MFYITIIFDCLQWLIYITLYLLFATFRTLSHLSIVVFVALLTRYLNIILSRRNRIKSSPDKCILITGATSGFGLALSKFYHRLGFTIFACYYNDKEIGYEELSKLNEDWGRMHLTFMDVTSLESIQNARKQIDLKMAENPELKLYCLVNNAGIAPSPKHLTMECRTMIERVCDTNLRGYMLTIREFMPLLIKGQGRIVNVSSLLAVTPLKLSALYCATKVAVYQMSCCIRNETEHFGVKTIVVLPTNAVRNTNIGSNFVDSLKRAQEELEPYERSIYKRLLTEYKEYIIHELDLMKRMKQGDTTLRPFNTLSLVSYFVSQQKQALSNDESNSLKSIITRYVASILSCLTEIPLSDNLEDSLEDSGLLEAFEDAILSNNPESVLFAGGKWYQFIFGPIMRWFPDSIKDYVLFYSKPDKEHYLDASLSDKLS